MFSTRHIRWSVAVLAVSAGLCAGQQIVLPTLPQAAQNFIPFGSGTTTMHQVFDASLFAALNGGKPVQIEEIAFSPGLSGFFVVGPVQINLGYTNLPPGGLMLPSTGGNPSGPMTLFFDSPELAVTVNTPGAEDWDEMTLAGTPFVYDPAQGNLLVEIVTFGGLHNLAVSRAAASSESTRAYDTAVYGSGANINATRMRFTYSPVGGGCYPDCDGNSTLDLFDFLCFTNMFNAGDPYADCDNSGTLDLFDFLCFTNAFNAGC